MTISVNYDIELCEKGVRRIAKVGRPSKYDQAVKPRLKQITEWVKVGATVENMCEILEIAPSTWHEYAKRYPEFAEAIKKGRIEFCLDLRGELAKLASRHTLETKKQYIKQDVETGHKTQYTEITTKEVDPDIAAINLLLKNLDRENWANDPAYVDLRRQELELRKQIAKAQNFDLEMEDGN